MDDFTIVAKDLESVMKEIDLVYLVKEDPKGPPDHYLSNDYKKDA